MDSSEEKVGKVDIDLLKVDRIKGGIDGLEDDRILLEDRGVVVEEDCGIKRLHIDIFLTSIIDRRRMNSSLIVQPDPVLTMQSCSFLLCQHIVDKVAQADHSVKGRAALPQNNNYAGSGKASVVQVQRPRRARKPNSWYV